jgi:AcrR family transcriptional regulator
MNRQTPEGSFMADAAMTPEQRIVVAAIECIESEGIEGATTRRIAAAAGMNVAAINYYFRSKENLVRLALDYSLRNAFDWEDFSETDEANAVDRLTAIMENLVEGVRRFPRLTRAHFSRPADREGEPSVSMQALSQFLRDLEDDLLGRDVQLDRSTLRNRLIQVITATVVATIFVPGLFDSYGGFSIDDTQRRSNYIRDAASAALRP